MGIIRTEPKVSGTSQILTNKTFDDEITVKEIGEPDSPAIGYRKVYFDFADGLYKAKSATGEVIILNSTGTGGEMAQYSAIKSYFKGEKCVGADGFEYRSLFNNNVGNPINFINGSGGSLTLTTISSTSATCATAAASDIPSSGIISIEDQLFEYSSLSLDRMTFNFGDNGNSTGGAGTSRRITETGWTFSADNSWSNGSYHLTLAAGMKVKSGYWKKVGYTKKYFLNKLPSSDTITLVSNTEYAPYYGASTTSAIIYSGGSGGGSGAGGPGAVRGGGAGGECKSIFTPKINIGTLLNLSPVASYSIGAGGAGAPTAGSSTYRVSYKGTDGTPSKFIDFYSPKTIGANGGYSSVSTDYNSGRGGDSGSVGNAGGHSGGSNTIGGNGGVGAPGFSGEVNAGGSGVASGSGGAGTSGASNNYGSGGGGGGGAGAIVGTNNGGAGGSGSNGCVIVIEEW